MKKTIYSKLSDVLSEPQKCKIFKKFNDDNQDAQIEAIQYFKNNIKPLWEDENNKNGGEIQFDISAQYYNIYNDLYHELLLTIIGQGNEEFRIINGIRILDKINARQDNRIRVELWLNINPLDTKENLELIITLEKWIRQLLEKYKIETIQLNKISHK